MHYFYLFVAIVAEVVGTSALKASDGFERGLPSLIVIVGYSVSFYFLAIAIRTIPVSIAYAIWSGVGIALIAIVGAVLFRQIPDAAAMAGIALIVCGVLVIHLFSESVAH